MEELEILENLDLKELKDLKVPLESQGLRDLKDQEVLKDLKDPKEFLGLTLNLPLKVYKEKRVYPDLLDFQDPADLREAQW
jgi:hypothetical protein